jgi:diketogulonate reductase-like aldo/keto reductase
MMAVHPEGRRKSGTLLRRGWIHPRNAPVYRTRSGRAGLVDGTAYVPFFPLGGFNPLQSSALSAVAADLGATPMQVALGWMLRRAPNILLFPGTSSVMHLTENLAATETVLSDDVIKVLDGVATKAA